MVKLEYREIKKSKIGVNKIAINYSPVISRITNIYPPLIVSPTHKRTEGRAPVWGSKFTSKRRRTTGGI